MDWEDGRRREGLRPASAPAAPGCPDGPAPAAVPAYAEVDADVPAAVRGRLQDWLAHRTAWAEALDETFAHDVAARLERFALGGGKRVRPRFLWWGLRGCARPCDARTRAALDLSAALELLQCCALIHDDVMDGDLVRRGEPSLHAAVAGQYAGVATGAGHRRLGESAAVLAGDLALAWADDIVGELELPAPVAKEIRSVWAVMRTEMVAGQYLDMHGAVTGTRSVARAVRAACLKSALYTVERPLQLGALLAGADAKTTAALRAAGRCAGIAFQLHDDVRDLYGEHGGRPPGQDIRSGKPTYLIAVALARAGSTGNATAQEVFARQVGRADLDADGLRAVRDAVTSTGARRIVTRRIDQLLTTARRHLSHVSPRTEGHDRLLALMYAAAGRPGATASVDPAVPHGTVREGATTHGGGVSLSPAGPHRSTTEEAS
ncbi:polyprenyl synthetase family protein [Streptomyces sp. NBC_00083]|uniref:polyprenyl synthetase family protein n=1 Tax=Streptomyces sp. NBC_00083 TaxID=2975647 RepID=UPI00225A87EA|nr:polyprenyl synthetase family protein [Streptomyces sp. NBC_00083]MCX5384528.1 polyprenyl synthetase family protein [Streptomyces sp. NBC_00083]